jgi:hypothetical protein
VCVCVCVSVCVCVICELFLRMRSSAPLIYFLSHSFSECSGTSRSLLLFLHTFVCVQWHFSLSCSFSIHMCVRSGTSRSFSTYFVCAVAIISLSRSFTHLLYVQVSHSFSVWHFSALSRSLSTHLCVQWQFSLSLALSPHICVCSGASALARRFDRYLQKVLEIAMEEQVSLFLLIF